MSGPVVNQMVDDLGPVVRHNGAEEHTMSNAYYLKLGSGKSQIFGDSRDRYHVGWIKLVGFSFVPPNGSGGGGAGPGRVTYSDIALTKFEDHSSPEIFVAVNEGRHFTSAVVEVADARTGIPKQRMTFTDVLLGTFSANPNAGLSDPGRSETFTLSFANMELNHNPIPEENVGDILQSVFKSLGLAPAQ